MEYPERPDCEFETPAMERCAKGDCRQLFYPVMGMGVKATIHGVEMRFCSEHCANSEALDVLGASGC